MNRRAVLAVTGLTLSTPLSGCLSTFRERSSSSALEPKEFPSHPEELTTDSVATFVEEFEEAKQYNNYLSEKTVDLNIGCRAAIDVERGNRYYLITRCMGSDRIEEGQGSFSVGEIGTSPIFYEITPDGTHRAERASNSSNTDLTGTGLRVVNFSQKEKRPTITIVSLDSPDDEPLFTEEFSPDPSSYIEQRSIIDNTSSYQVTVKFGTGRSEQYEWEVTTLEPRVGVNIYLTADGHIEFGTLDEPY